MCGGDAAFFVKLLSLLVNVVVVVVVGGGGVWPLLIECSQYKLKFQLTDSLIDCHD